MKTIVLAYKVIADMMSPSSDRLQKTSVRVPDNFGVDTLISRIPAKGLSPMVLPGEYSRTLLTEGELVDGGEYLVKGYDALEIQERLRKGFK